MSRAPSGKAHSRTLIAVLAAALLVSLPAAAPAFAQSGGSGGPVAPGGTQFALKPVITGLTCLQRCAASSSASRRAVGVRAEGLLKIRGRNLSGVRTVIFTGRAGTRDDVRVSPDGVGRMSVDVEVPARATSGPIVLLATTYSPPSSQPVLVLPKNQPRQDDDEDKDGSAPQPAPGPPSAQGLIWPVPRAPIFGVFGENRGSHYHSGIDISAPVGTPIRAAAAGKILFAGLQGAYGNFICIAHSTVSSCYAHLGEMLVTTGMSVSRGQLIGKVGMTGRTTGPHLHFEVRQGLAMWAKPINPMAFLPGGATAARASAATDPLDYDLPVYGLGN